MSYVIGLDYGTDSVRAILTSTVDGRIVDTAVFEYPRWKRGEFCDSGINKFRQHPADHVEGLESAINELIQKTEVDKTFIKGICVDATGSSPMAVDECGESLAFSAGFEQNPNAMMILWKDHCAIEEANEITRLARSWGGEDFTKYAGGIYSSEWFWAKILYIMRRDESVASSAFSWMEHCDYITGLLTGKGPLEIRRSRCAAGHKALWHEDWNGLPPKEFLSELDPRLADLRDRLYEKTYTSDQAAGNLSASWASRLGLSEETVVAVGIIDAHAGAVGAGITPNTLVKVIGTSTCDILVAPHREVENKLVRGICGQVDGSVLPGFVGLEAGQAAFGDVLAWMTRLILEPPIHIIKASTSLSFEDKEKLIQEMKGSIMDYLSHKAESSGADLTGLTAIDWLNGRRSPDVNESLEGAVMGLNMGTKAEHLFKSFVEALCFGSKRIVERLEEHGLVISEVIAIGGVANKSKLVMQTMADILERPIKLTASTQTPALGSAMYAATASGIFPDLQTAISLMEPGFDMVFSPNPNMKERYEVKYRDYKTLGALEEYQKKSNRSHL